MTTLVCKEIREINSRYVDGTLIYPGRWVLTWIKAPFMPWVLAGMEQAI